ncbi:hypothetical protein [Jeotgalibacillus aurantiacus]|uniref:hypothetical protein n=1 Tax=Jeotgalibacillus aurantiacus TaxID=2763266 RepID=UPI001D0BB7C4|nr:hypothetical protein [Jeotgalibacillus aurantiacus]
METFKAHIPAGIQAYLSGLIDYAGLFPPAQLSMNDAVRNYASYLADKDAWMLGRFIIPAVRLNELQPYLKLFTQKQRLDCSVIARKSPTDAEVLPYFKEDLQVIRTFLAKAEGQVAVSMIELPLPATPEPSLLKEIAEQSASLAIRTFLELPDESAGEQRLLKALDAIAHHNRTQDTTLGFKFRTGGVTAAAFPEPKQLAWILKACSDRGVPQKFTAGLHHPVRMYRSEVQTEMHGFLNVFTAAMLTRVHNLAPETITEILKDQNSTDFTLSKTGAGWRELGISVEEIKKLRKTAFISYGSCSFTEPLEDLRTLGLLNE